MAVNGTAGVEIVKAGRHVALVTPRLVKRDGQGRVNYEVVKRWIDQGGSVTALTFDVEPELLDEKRFQWVPTGTASLPSDLLRSQFFSLQSGRWLKRHRDQFDVVHTNGSVSLSSSDINSCHFVHGAWAASTEHTSRSNRSAYGLYHRMLTALHARQERIAYGRARHVVAISQHVREQLLAIGVPDEKIRVIWNGIDIDEFRPGTGDRAALGLPKDRFLALFAGDMRTPRKNLDTVLAAIRAIPAIHLVIAGDLTRNPYPAKVRQMGLADRVTFLGFRSDVADVMRAVDAFVYPARYEPLGLVVLEALASGLPVLTAATTGASALVDHNCGLVLQDPNDAKTLERFLERLIADPPLRRRMGEAARQRALTHTWRHMADEYTEMYERIAAGA